MPSFITTHLWKIATGAAGVLTIILCGLLIASTVQNRDLASQRGVLSAQINDPKTGYIAQLAQSRTNVAQLEKVVETQSEAYDTLSKESTARLAAASAALASAKRATVAMEKQLAGFMATKPQGATLEDRVRDIDDRAMKEFLP